MEPINTMDVAVDMEFVDDRVTIARAFCTTPSDRYRYVNAETMPFGVGVAVRSRDDRYESLYGATLATERALRDFLRQHEATRKELGEKLGVG